MIIIINVYIIRLSNLIFDINSFQDVSIGKNIYVILYNSFLIFKTSYIPT